MGKAQIPDLKKHFYVEINNYCRSRKSQGNLYIYIYMHIYTHTHILTGFRSNKIFY